MGSTTSDTDNNFSLFRFFNYARYSIFAAALTVNNLCRKVMSETGKMQMQKAGAVNTWLIFDLFI